MHGAAIDVGGTEKKSELLFFFFSVLLPQRTEGDGINHADNCAPHNEQCLLENQAIFKTERVKMFCCLGCFESFRRQGKHA